MNIFLHFFFLSVPAVDFLSPSANITRENTPGHLFALAGVAPRTKTWRAIDSYVNIPRSPFSTARKSAARYRAAAGLYFLSFYSTYARRAYLDLALDRAHTYTGVICAFQKIIGPYLWLYIPTGDTFLLLLLFLLSARINCSQHVLRSPRESQERQSYRPLRGSGKLFISEMTESRCIWNHSTNSAKTGTRG